jgi:ATP-dependent Clp protease ATP-binding subunit ClpA
MFSKDLEFTIGQCYKQARENRHEFMTVEHLLLALLDNPSAAGVLRACGADLNKLATELKSIIAETVPVLPGDDTRDTQPTLGFQRVLQRAVYHVQSSGRKEVTGANVLVAIFGEKDSHAVYFLQPAGSHPPRRGQLHFARGRQDREPEAQKPEAEPSKDAERRGRAQGQSAD